MSEADVETQKLIEELPTYYASSEESGNWEILRGVGEQLSTLEGDIQSLRNETKVQLAEDIDSLEEHAKFVGIERNPGESIGHFRARIIAEYQLNTSEGSIQDIFNAVSAIIDCGIDDLWYQDWRNLFGEAYTKTVTYLLPYTEVQESELSPSEISEIVGRLTTTGTTVRSQYNGSFRYVSEETYNEENWTGYENGYDSLEDGSPTGEGGTKGSLIN